MIHRPGWLTMYQLRGFMFYVKEPLKSVFHIPNYRDMLFPQKLSIRHSQKKKNVGPPGFICRSKPPIYGIVQLLLFLFFCNLNKKEETNYFPEVFRSHRNGSFIKQNTKKIRRNKENSTKDIWLITLNCNLRRSLCR
jgi:hypothetical protein